MLMKSVVGTAAILTMAACAAEEPRTIPEGDFVADIWVDNWFQFYLGEELIHEDGTPFNTERSFNAETFGFDGDFPLQLNLVARDFFENKTGLEYIGARNQQMGDGGFIAQFKRGDTGEVIATSNSDWMCLVLHAGPLDRSCEDETSPTEGVAPCEFREVPEPEGWKALDFDDSSWSSAAEFTASEVRPKGGYDEIDWDSAAKIVWTDDLEVDNTLICRLTVEE